MKYRTATYRLSDRVVLWIGDSSNPDYIGPLLHEGLRQKVLITDIDNDHVNGMWVSFPQFLECKEPEDSENILLWRSKLEALNYMACVLSVERARLVPPVYLQNQIYAWKSLEARSSQETAKPMLQSYADMSNLSLDKAVLVSKIRDVHMYQDMVESEERRLRWQKSILECSSREELQSVMKAI